MNTVNHQVTAEEMDTIHVSQTLASQVSKRLNVNKRLIFEYDIRQGVETFIVVDNGKRQIFDYLGSAVDAYNAI